jgi:hypothetical protein
VTRVNLVPPAELCDQHLLAEHREITRIPSLVKKRKVNLDSIPQSYRIRSDAHPELGRGHVAFFYDKLGWLLDRYSAVHNECRRRGFDVGWNWTQVQDLSLCLWWQPSPDDVQRNRNRIHEQMPPKPRFTRPV